MTFDEKVESLIGTPYDSARFNCWTLVEELVPGAPKLNVIGGNYSKSIKEFKKNTPTYLNQFKEIQQGVETGDIILAGNNHINHAGVIYNDSGNILVIHNDIKGVHVEPIYYFKKLYKQIKVLRCQ